MTEAIYTTGDYLGKNPTWHTEDSPWKSRQILKIMERNNLKPASICEVGCGSGEILNQLYLNMPETVNFTGYEVSPQAFAMAQPRSKPRLDFHLGDLLQEENLHFDIMLCIDVFEHIEDYLGFLKSLRPKATHKIFHIPLDLSVSSVLRSSAIMRARQAVGHLHYYSKETALATLKDSGYEIVDHFYTAGALDLPNKSMKTTLANFPRRMLYKVNPDLAVRLLGGYSLLVLAK